MTTKTSLGGRVALAVSHCAGMVDLVALPVWVGALIARYGFDPQQAGLLATLFLAAAVAASLVLAPRFQRLRPRVVATAGFTVAAACFFAASTTTTFATLALLHAAAGLAAGSALSVTHGTIACSANPHRLFAVVNIALGVFAIAFLGATPKAIDAGGGPVLFVVFAAVMAVAAIVALLAFPAPERLPSDAHAAIGATPSRATPAARLPAAVWFGIVAVGCMALVQSMTFAFLERAGADRGFGVAAITGVLIALGFVNLLPAAIAAVLEKRSSARTVMLVGPVLQALLANTIMNATGFAAYAGAAAVFAAVMIFTHTFAFGLLARLEPTGRAMAATPAMLMIGAAIGPILGGTLVKNFGYPAIGVAAVVVAAVAVWSVSRIPAQSVALPSSGRLA